MKSKGQLFALDFIIAMVIVMLGLGVLLNYVEINSHALKEMSLNNELEIQAKTAFTKLMQEANCEVDNYANPGLFGCINKSALTNLAKEKIIDKINFNCRIEVEENQLGLCNDNPENQNNVSVIERTLPLIESSITKKELNDCFAGNCNNKIQSKKITLKVWFK